MPRITIDQRDVEVSEGSTILDAAQKLGIEIPTLCFLKGRQPLTSCMVCVVKIEGRENLVPACATVVVDGMRVQSDCDEVRHARRAALELLLSDHVGDCLAPCQLLCAEGMNIPQMLRQIAAGDLAAAAETIMREMALPAVLARVCTKPCEKGCRRASLDAAVAICDLKGLAADAKLAARAPYLPQRLPATGKRVAVVGAGPTGISAAYHLALLGHTATVFERESRPGGRLLRDFDRQSLPAEVLHAEVELIARLGVEFRTSTPVTNAPVVRGSSPTFEEIMAEFDAVLIASGAKGATGCSSASISGCPGVFAAGDAVRPAKLIVRLTADGKQAARSIGRYLVDPQAGPIAHPFNIKAGRMTRDELVLLAREAGRNRWVPMAARQPVLRDGSSAAGSDLQKASQEAARCLHCDCRAQDSCELRRYSGEYGANPSRFRHANEERRPVELFRHKDRIMHEPGKCIRCGRCIAIVNAAEGTLSSSFVGLTFVGRGFDVQVAAAFNRPLGDVFDEGAFDEGAFNESTVAALDELAAQCIAACPTAALSRP